MINIEELSEQELLDLKNKLDEKLKYPVCPCCNTRCGKYQIQVNTIIKEVGIPVPCGIPRPNWLMQDPYALWNK